MHCDPATLAADVSCELSCLPVATQWAVLIKLYCDAAGSSCTLSELEAQAACIQQCVPTGFYVPILIMLSQEAAGDTQTPQELTAAAACFLSCTMPGQHLPMLIEVWKTATDNTLTDSELANAARCIEGCLPDGLFLPVLILLAQQIAGNTQTGSALANSARCIECNIPVGMQLPVLIEMTCEQEEDSLAAPVALDATDVDEDSFQANWSAVPTATGYFLDVSTAADFSSFVPGYDNVNVGLALGFVVDFLDPDTTYYYRVRATDGVLLSANSNVITVETDELQPPLTNLRLWLKADAIEGVADGGGVAQWDDSSGNGFHGVAGTVDLPTYHLNLINGLPAVRFTPPGVNEQYYDFPNMFAGGETGAEIFIVVRLVNDPPLVGGGGCWRLAGSGDLNFYPWSGDSGVYDGFAATVRKTVGNLVPSLASWRLWSTRSENGAWNAELDGTNVHSDAGNVFTTGVGASTRSLGRTGSASTDMNGWVAEVLLYNVVLSAANRLLVKQYISAKYGLTIA